MKDVLRRKRRVLYATLGVVVGTMTVIAILTIARAGEARIYDQLEKYGPNLTVMPATQYVEMRLGDLNLGTLTVGENYIAEETLPRVRQIADDEIRKALGVKEEANIATVAPKLYVNTKLREVSVVVVGVDPLEERKVKTWWEIRNGGYLERADQALVGSMAASVLKAKVGDMVSLGDGQVTVVGILGETGSTDDYQVFIPIGTVQKAFDKEGQISSIDVRALCTACPVEYIADKINQQVPGVRAVAVKQIAEAETDLMERMNRFMVALAGITVALGLFGVTNTMMGSVHERVKDIGIMRAVGASRNQIIKVFAYEAVVVGILGGVLGYLFGTLLSYAIGPLLFEGIPVTYILHYLPLSLVLATLVAVIASAYPAFRATRIKVSDSFRSL
ncbi:MAG: FtsX-like permease family protein [Chloroflexota bacterium]